MVAAAQDLHSAQTLRMGCKSPCSSISEQEGAIVASGHREWLVLLVCLCRNVTVVVRNAVKKGLSMGWPGNFFSLLHPHIHPGI